MLPRSEAGRVEVAADLDAAIDTGRLVADVGRLVATSSVTGDDVAAQQVVADLATTLGLDVEMHEEPLAALRAAADYPGEEVSRDRLVTVAVRLPGASPDAPRLCIAGHVDVVPPGDRPWTTPPFTADVRDGWLFGRGAADMKAAVVAGLHVLAAVKTVLRRPPGDVVLLCVGAEEDGGLGAFAALRRDDAFAGCVIGEPTDGAVVCAQAGALTWSGRIAGRAAHASVRLEGVSALDRFLPVYRALQDLERSLNEQVSHPLMRELPLPYPLSVGRVRAGDWASTVPDELVFDGRVGVPVGTTPDEVRRQLERTVAAAADDQGPPPVITWTGGQFAPAETDPSDRVVRLLRESAGMVDGREPALAGAPYGTDLRHFVAHGVPTVLFGPGQISRAHATDEAVEIAAVVRHARTLARLAAVFGAG